MDERRRGLLVDVAGVVIRTPFELLDGAAQRHGLVAGSLGSRGPFADRPDPEFARITRREITEREYWTPRSQCAADPLDTGDGHWSFMRALFDAPPEELLRPATVALLTELHERDDAPCRS